MLIVAQFAPRYPNETGCELTARPVRDDAGRLEQFIATIHDITERVKAIAEERTPYVVDGALPKDELARLVKDLEAQMKIASRNLEFEKAALLRDQIVDLRKVLTDEAVR